MIDVMIHISLYMKTYERDDEYGFTPVSLFLCGRRGTIRHTGSGALTDGTTCLDATNPRMEEELSVRLIERAGRGIRITPSGNRLYERAVSLLQFEQETRMELSDIEAGRTGILRIGVNTLSASRLVDWIEQMKRRHPGIILQVHQGESSALIERLKERSLDAALVRLPIDAQGVSIEWMEEELFHQVWHPDHPTADLIIPSQEGLGVVSQETCSDVLTLIGLVRKGKAVTVLPESTLRELDTAGLHQTYLSGAASTTAFVWLTETGPTTLTKQFIEIMQETVD